MTRNRASAKQAGARFERLAANYLKQNLSEFIDRKVQTGTLDTGDINNVRTIDGKRVTVECKDYGGRLKLGPWMGEAEAERINDKGVAAVVIAKRMGTTVPGEQWVITTLDDLIVLLGGERPND